MIKSKQTIEQGICYWVTEFERAKKRLFIDVCILQLQDTLLQKEEELARLHEENNNLRQYLNSAVVKCLEEKAKVLCSDLPRRSVSLREKEMKHLGEMQY